MSKKVLYPVWIVLYIICVCLGAITQRNTTGEAVMTAVSILFFIPGFWLLIQALRTADVKELKRLRLISGLSLGLTVLALSGIILSVLGPQLLGDILNVVLLMVSAPMLCCKYWALSLLLWAVLFLSSFPRFWKK